MIKENPSSAEATAGKRVSKYMLYAIGEIVLVVIGILIALQINNGNEAKKERAKEISYLKNIKVDLNNEIENNEQFASYHFQKAKTCATLLGAEAPATIKDVQTYTDRFELVFMWRSFVPNNNTFKELLSSGNLSLIKNDAIKDHLLELDKRYAEISGAEYHMRREYEEYLYDPHVKNASALEFFDTSKPYYGLPDRLSFEDIPASKHEKLIAGAQWQHNDQTFQNGLKLALMNNSILASMHHDLVKYIQEMLDLIDKEVNR